MARKKTEMVIQWTGEFSRPNSRGGRDITTGHGSNLFTFEYEDNASSFLIAYKQAWEQIAKHLIDKCRLEGFQPDDFKVTWLEIVERWDSEP